jgi:hypothetical protein
MTHANAVPLSTVIPTHSRPKDGVLSHAYVAGIHVSLQHVIKQDVDCRA